MKTEDGIVRRIYISNLASFIQLKVYSSLPISLVPDLSIEVHN